MLRVPYRELFETLLQVLLRLGFAEKPGSLCARLFAEASRDGVHSHGLNRFPLFVSAIRNGIVDIHATPQLVSASGALERWDGRVGPGNVNAYRSMERAIELSRTHGMGCVALANTNHWMRGGSYGWQAADEGVIGICWTNTLPNLPPWGSSRPLLGNNPLVIAVPRPEGNVVLDMAMSQFSYGALASYRTRGEMLPVEGGFDREGRLTRAPEAIEASKRPLPIGYWKGSGLALMLDLVAGILSGGSTTHQIPAEPGTETRISQVFVALDPSTLGTQGEATRIASEVIDSLQTQAQAAGESVRYPGQQVLRTRRENLEQGVPVEPIIWAKVRKML